VTSLGVVDKYFLDMICVGGKFGRTGCLNALCSSILATVLDPKMKGVQCFGIFASFSVRCSVLGHKVP
jgi:hypothetical protein